ncbi:unnamed protein product [Ilex paraguariensis]
MTFSESASFIGSQVLGNWLVGRHVVFPSSAALFLAIISVIYITQAWKEAPRTAEWKDYKTSFYVHIFGDKKILLLAWALACVQSSVAILWILWAPTIVKIGVLVTLFCLFHACMGLVLPSLARLRTMYVPNEMRGGMISLSVAPANAAILFFLVQGGYYRNIGNSTIIAVAALCLFSAAGCMHLLRQWGKQIHQNWLKL